MMHANKDILKNLAMYSNSGGLQSDLAEFIREDLKEHVEDEERLRTAAVLTEIVNQIIKDLEKRINPLPRRAGDAVAFALARIFLLIIGAFEDPEDQERILRFVMKGVKFECRSSQNLN